MEKNLHSYLAQIKVVGVGGAGGNAINRMREAGLKGVEFICINTDAQVLMSNEADVKIAIGTTTTRGLGAGGDPEVGRAAAEEDIDEIRSAINGADMVFIAVGEGGGTGTGAAPIIADIAREVGSLTISVATRPFDFEGDRRRDIAEQGLLQLRDKVDAQIVIPNQRLLSQAHGDIPIVEAFSLVDEILHHSVRGVTDLITRPGLINTDFADVKTILGNSGSALVGVGEAKGEERASNAARKAISNPLLEDSMHSARGIILNITAGNDPPISLREITEAADIVESVAHAECNTIFGQAIDESMGDKLRVTVIAAGFIGPNISSDTYSPGSHSGSGGDSAGIIDSLNENNYAGQDFDDEDFDLPDFLK